MKERKWRKETLEEVGRWDGERNRSRCGKKEINAKEESSGLDEEHTSELEDGQKVKDGGGPMTESVKCNDSDLKVVETSVGDLVTGRTISFGLESIEGVAEEIKDTENLKEYEKTLKADVANTKEQERLALEKSEVTEHMSENFKAERTELEEAGKCKSGSGESEGQEANSATSENSSQGLNAESQEKIEMKLLVEASSAECLPHDHPKQMPETDDTGGNIKPHRVGLETVKSLAATDYASKQADGSQKTEGGRWAVDADNKQLVEDQETRHVLTGPLKSESSDQTPELRTDEGECLMATETPTWETDKSSQENNRMEETGCGPAHDYSPPTTESPDNSIELILNEIRTHLTEKDVHIQPLLGDFSEFADVQTDRGRFGHVIEVYGFSSELCTDDLMEAFTEYRDKGFRLQWVDKSHALGIFSSPEDAYAASCRTHSAMKFRPLSQGSRQSKIVAHEKADIMQPTRDRPQTDASVAKRLLNRALGLPNQSKDLPVME